MGESRAIVYDSELKLEAYRFRGIRQEFPKHFQKLPQRGLNENLPSGVMVNTAAILGLAICGDAKKVNSLTGAMPLLR